MITEDYVSFETAKLLKEKGFDDEYTNAFYDKTENLYFIDLLSDLSNHQNNYTDIAASTLYVAMKWLRDEKHYYIQVMLDGWACGDHSGYYVVIQKTDSDFEMMLQDAVDEVFYQTYEEACEAAIKYCLENFI